MDNRKPPRSEAHAPVTGDYSEAQNARLRASTPEPPRAAPPPAQPQARAPRQEDRARDDRLLIDPSDMQRHARLARQRERRPSGKLRVYVGAAVVVALAGVAYWNFDTLRGITFDFSQVTSLFDRGAPGAGGNSRGGGAIETAPVESQSVAGAAVATSLSDARPAEVPPPVAAPPPASGAQPVEQSAADPTVAVV